MIFFCSDAAASGDGNRVRGSPLGVPGLRELTWPPHQGHPLRSKIVQNLRSQNLTAPSSMCNKVSRATRLALCTSDSAPRKMKGFVTASILQSRVVNLANSDATCQPFTILRATPTAVLTFPHIGSGYFERLREPGRADLFATGGGSKKPLSDSLRRPTPS